jgi:hypothetical protein
MHPPLTQEIRGQSIEWRRRNQYVTSRSDRNRFRFTLEPRKLDNGDRLEVGVH